MADLQDKMNLSSARICVALLASTLCLLSTCAAQQTPRPVVLIGIRLVNGPIHAPNSGRVEVLHSTSGAWLNVCDFNFWGDNDGSVACRQLGFPGYSRVRRESYFGEGTNNGSVGAIACDGSEDSLGQCEHGPVRESTGCEGRVSGLICTVPGFLGCYSDDRNDRVFMNPKLQAGNMTVDVCLSHCRKLGQRYAGLENKKDCYCGDADTDIDKHGRLLDKNCRSECSGNVDQVCGGGGRLSIYDLTLGHCPDPGSPANGVRVSSTIDVFIYASNITFYCNDGFELVGSDTITCVLGNSPQEVKWSAPLPQCAAPAMWTTQSSDSDNQASSVNLGRIVGAVIASVVFLVLLAIFLMCIIKRKRTQTCKSTTGAPLDNIYAQPDDPSRYQTTQALDTQYQDLTLPSKETDKPYMSLGKRDPVQEVDNDVPDYFEFDDDYSPVGDCDGANTGHKAVGQTKHLPSPGVDDNEYSFIDQTKDFNASHNNHSSDNKDNENPNHYLELDSDNPYYNLPNT